MSPERLRRIELEHCRQIRGRIADAIRERIEQISAAIKVLNDHLDDCDQCQIDESPYRLCPKGNLLFRTVLEA